MKSRFALLFVLAAFLNPISVFAVDYSNGKTACEDWVNGKILAADKIASANTASTNGTASSSTSKKAN